MSLSNDQAAFTADIAALIQFGNRHPRRRVRLFHAKRDTEWQQMMHERSPGTYAPAEKSQHPDALAADLILDEMIGGRWEYQTDSEAYRHLGIQWELMSIWNRWGGRFARGDGGHFERLRVPREGAPLIA